MRSSNVAVVFKTEDWLISNEMNSYVKEVLHTMVVEQQI